MLTDEARELDQPQGIEKMVDLSVQACAYGNQGKKKGVWKSILTTGKVFPYRPNCYRLKARRRKSGPRPLAKNYHRGRRHVGIMGVGDWQLYRPDQVDDLHDSGSIPGTPFAALAKTRTGYGKIT